MSDPQPPVTVSNPVPVARTYQPSSVFMYSGLAFLFGALVLYFVLGACLYEMTQGKIMVIEVPESPILSGPASGTLTQRDMYNYYGRIAMAFTAPVLLVIAAMVCTVVGVKLLRAAGVVTQQVIPPQDFELLAPAIRDGNEKAISEYIRLSSLLGATGTFTKIGLTGLPLATIVLTVILSFLGVFNAKFFDLAQLTLGAFIGSYVQKRSELGISGYSTTKGNSANDANRHSIE